MAVTWFIDHCNYSKVHLHDGVLQTCFNAICMQLQYAGQYTGAVNLCDVPSVSITSHLQS